MALTLTLCSPDRKLFDRKPVKEVTIPGFEGEIQVLPEHGRMVGTLETGILSYRGEDGGETIAAISSGFFEVADDHVMVLAETLELNQEVDRERAKRAQSAAELKLNDASLEPDTFRKYQLKLQRALVRQQVATTSSTEASN